MSKHGPPASRTSLALRSGITPRETWVRKMLFRTNCLPPQSAAIASMPPMAAAIIASMMNGSWVIQREAPTSRMMLVSARRCWAATWMVIAIMITAQNSTTTAPTIESSRALSMMLRIVSMLASWFCTLSTPGCFSYFTRTAS